MMVEISKDEIMWQKFTEEFSRNDITFYKCLESDDLSDIVMKLYEKLRYEPFHRIIETKTESKSHTFRELGNNAFKTQNYKEALKFYNRALCNAPKGSVALNLAYSNRSALLFYLKDYKGALKDIDTCYSLTYPEDVMKKLKIREEMCRRAVGHNMWIDDLKSNARTSFPLHLLDLKGEHNEQIPCASRAVRLDRDRPGPRAAPVAARPVAPGTVLARETAFVSTMADENIFFLCHYCMKSSFNLIPCDNCCVAMFCDNNCKNKCDAEYHIVECKVPERLHLSEILLIALKAIIKMKNSYDSWENFLQASHIVEQEVDPKELFNGRHALSLLYKDTVKSVPFGAKYNCAFSVTMLLKGLEESTSFFPLQQTKRDLAIHTMARLLMFLSLVRQPVFMRQTAEHLDVFGELYTTVSFFNFLGRLKHSCDPNLLMVPMNDQAALVALRPISPGTPLTVSYVGHYHRIVHGNNKPYKLYQIVNTVCYCCVCTEEWGKHLDKNYKLSASQKLFLKKNKLELLPNRMLFLISNVDGQAVDYYQKICEGLRLFSDLRNTVEYLQLFITLNLYLQVLLVSITGNKYLTDLQ